MCYLISTGRVRRWLSQTPTLLGPESTMRSRARSKTVRKTRARKIRHAAGKRSGSKKTRIVRPPKEGSMAIPEMDHGPTVKKCEELEVGDIGNFGSSDELEEHEKRCSEPATQFCHMCGRNLCGSHYDLLHRDHDSTGHLPSSPVQ